MSTIYYLHLYREDTDSVNVKSSSSPKPIPYNASHTNSFSDRIYHSRNHNARFYVVTFGYQENWLGESNSLQRRVDRYTVHFIFDGKAEFNGVTVQSGQIYIVCPNETYSIKHFAQHPLTSGWIALSGKELELMMEILHLPKQQLWNIPKDNMEQIRAAFLDTVYGDHTNAELPYFILGRFFDVMSLTEISYHNSANIQSTYVNTAEKFINTNYMYDITVADIANSANISVSYLRNLYAQELGISPQKSIQQKRVAVAKALLKQGSASIASISESVGYINQSAFIKRFKNETGMTPLEYRKKNQSQKP